MKQQQKTNYMETSLNEPREVVYNSMFLPFLLNVGGWILRLETEQEQTETTA